MDGTVSYKATEIELLIVVQDICSVGIATSQSLVICFA